MGAYGSGGKTTHHRLRQCEVDEPAYDERAEIQIGPGRCEKVCPMSPDPGDGAGTYGQGRTHETTLPGRGWFRQVAFRIADVYLIIRTTCDGDGSPDGGLCRSQN